MIQFQNAASDIKQQLPVNFTHKGPGNVLSCTYNFMECISQLPDKYDDIKIESVERVNEVRKLLVLSVETNSWKVSKSYFLTALHEFSHCIDRSIAVVQATERTLPSITTENDLKKELIISGPGRISRSA